MPLSAYLLKIRGSFYHYAVWNDLKIVLAIAHLLKSSVLFKGVCNNCWPCLQPSSTLFDHLYIVHRI